MHQVSRVTELCKILFSKASKKMHEPLVPILFPLLEHIRAVMNFSIRTSFGRKLVAKMAILVAESGGNMCYVGV